MSKGRNRHDSASKEVQGTGIQCCKYEGYGEGVGLVPAWDRKVGEEFKAPVPKLMPRNGENMDGGVVQSLAICRGLMHVP